MSGKECEQHNENSCRTNHDRSDAETDLLSPMAFRGVHLRNRIVVSPMCQYCSQDGFADDWHLVHLGTRAVGGAGLVFTEATAVTPHGRISGGDLGLWKDEQIEKLSQIVQFIHRMGAVAGIQLAHAGRKGSCLPPWNEQGRLMTMSEGGWRVVAPSAIPFLEANPAPEVLDQEGIKQIIKDFLAAAKRALKAGFKVIEVHSAHGYLLHSFLSPLSNRRTDHYGGSLENRMRLLLELVTELRTTLPEETPLFVRISGTDWVEGGWDIEQSVVLAKALKEIGVDLIDVSSGGLVPYATIPLSPGYQVPLSARIRKESHMMTGAVGLITEPSQANDIVRSGQADLVFFAREMLRNPYFALQAEKTLGQEANWPLQYGYALKRRTR